MNDTLTEKRRRFWSRLRGLQLLPAFDLVRVHRHAQQHGCAPEEALVVLGLLTETEVIEILEGERALCA